MEVGQNMSVSPIPFSRPAQGPMAYIEKILCDDVLSEIFKFVVDDEDEDAFSLSQVDIRWRALALSDSTLWTMITIDERVINQSIPVRRIGRDKPSREHWAPPVFPRVALMLERSRTRLIDVAIEIPICGLGRLPFDYYHSEFLAMLLFPHALRIESFSIQTSYWKHHTLILSIFHSRVLPNLVNLEIQRHYMPLQEFEPHFDQATFKEGPCSIPSAEHSSLIQQEGTADEDWSVLYPRLRNLALTGTSHDWDFFVGMNLTSLSITALPFRARPTVAQLLQILSFSHATVEYLELTGSLPFVEPTEREHYPPIILENLTDLTLGYTMALEVDLFVDYFRVPSLLALSINNLDARQPADMDFQEETQIYHDTLSAFTNILQHFPLEKLDEFTLSGAQFGYTPPYLPTEEVCETGRIKLNDLPVPFQLVQRLSNVTSLTLENPDRVFLTGMLYPQLDKVPRVREVGDDDDEELMIPIVFSTVLDFHIDVNNDETAHRSIIRYLNDRWERFIEEDVNGDEAYVGATIQFMELEFPRMTTNEFCTTNWKCLNIADNFRVVFNDPFHYEPAVYESSAHSAND